MKKIIVIASIVSLFFILFLVFTFTFEPVIFWPLFENKIIKTVSLNGMDSEAWETWSSTDFENAPKLLESYIFYNYTNYEDVLKGKKPIVKEVGPFVYRIHRHKFDVTFDDNNETVKFKEWSYYTFEKDLSIGDPNNYDIVIPSPPYFGLLNKIKLELMLPTAYTPAVLNEVIQHVNGQFKYDLYSFSSSSYIQETSQYLIEKKMIDDDLSYPEAQLWFFEQFANRTSNSGNQLIDGMSISLGESLSLLSVESCQLLFTEDQPYSLVSRPDNFTDHSIEKWIKAREDTVLAEKLKTLFKITARQLNMISLWLESSRFHQYIIEPKLLEKFNIETMNDLDCYQWSGVSDINESLATLYPIQFSHGYPEFRVWAIENGYDPNFMDVNNCKLLFRDRDNIRAINHTETYMLFNSLLLNSILTQNYTEVHEKWNISSFFQAKALLDYFSYLKDGYSEARVNYWLRNGSGIFPKRTAYEWLFNYTEPIVSRLSESTRSPNFKQNKTSIDHARETTKFSTIYTGVNNISRIYRYKEFQEQKEIDWMYPKPISVFGSTESGQFKPLLSKAIEPLHVFQDEYMKILKLSKIGEKKIKNIPNYLYTVNNETWAIDESMNNFIEGFWNVSAKFNNSPIFLGMPHFKGVSNIWKDKIGGDIHNENGTDITHIYVEPWSGRVMRLSKSIQINIHISNDTKWFFLSPYHSEMVTDIVLPLMWVKQNMEMTDELVLKLNKIQRGLKIRMYIKLSSFGLTVILALISIILTVTSIRIYRKKHHYRIINE